MKEYELVETKDFQLAIQTPEGKVLTQEQALAEILSIVEEIKQQNSDDKTLD